jgi:hypothetical protein
VRHETLHVSRHVIAYHREKEEQEREEKFKHIKSVDFSVNSRREVCLWHKIINAIRRFRCLRICHPEST